MRTTISTSRRRALQLLTALPTLPLASSLAGLPLAALAKDVERGTGVTYRFGAMEAPSLANPLEMATTQVAST
jgi:hypothetical protein